MPAIIIYLTFMEGFVDGRDFSPTSSFKLSMVGSNSAILDFHHENRAGQQKVARFATMTGVA
jgi:hypothetical protein